MKGELRFESQGPHPYVFFAVPFGIVLLAMAVLGIWLGPRDVGAAFGELVATVLGAWVLTSSAYGIWGRIVITRDENQCVVTRSLGGYSRSVTFFVADIRSVERWTPSPGVLLFPGSAGTHLRLTLEHRQRPLAIADGLCLSDDDLAAIDALLSARDHGA